MLILALWSLLVLVMGYFAFFGIWAAITSISEEGSEERKEVEA